MANNPKAKENLVPIPKGTTRNPNGRPVGSRNVSTVLKEMLAEIAPNSVINEEFIKQFCKGKKNITIAHAFAARMINEGLVNGESWAFKEVLDRSEGKAKQSIEIEAKQDEKLVAIKQAIQANAERKGIPYEEELNNYVERYALPDIKEKLVSEMEN